MWSVASVRAKDGERRQRAIASTVHALNARKPGRPVEGEAKTAVSLRIPNSVLTRWKSTGPGWQTRMVQRLSKPLAKSRLPA
jgi:uncharacterized protein (DUF4415 family)